MGKKTVREAEVIDLEKRRIPNKHYVYILEVSWSEGTTTLIYRRYSDFFEFQCELLEKFPEEAGADDPATRMIPFLPGKKLLGRSHTRAVAEKRKQKLNDYCKSLIRLPSKISDSQFVIEFFEVRPEDITPVTEKSKDKKASTEQISEISDPLVLERFVAVADYEKQKKNECSLVAGQTVEVIDKNANGWWFVNVDDFNEGWVPATFLEPLYGTEESVGSQVMEPGEEEIHIAMSGYSAQNEDEISFEKGVLLEVFEKNFDGWWKVKYHSKEGFAPAAFLQRYHGATINTEVTTGAQVVTSIKEAIAPSNTAESATGWKPVKSSKPAESAPWKPVESPPPPTIVESSPVTSPTEANHTPLKLPEIKAKREPPKSPKPYKKMNVFSPEPVESAKPLSPPKTPEKKFAPTWHSVQQPYIDKEPIYAPTPRIFAAAKKKKKPPPPLKPKPTSPTCSSPSELESSVYDLPGPVYESVDHVTPKEQIYLTIGEFKPGNAGDGLSFTAGVLVSVITKNPTGWWYVDLDGVEGWVPSSYLESQKSSTPTSPVGPKEPPPPLPARNSISAVSKKEIFPERAGQNKTLSSSTGKVKTVALASTQKSSSSNLRRSQSTESLDRPNENRPVIKRPISPPAIHVSSKSTWKPKQPGPVKPYRSPQPVIKTTLEPKKSLSNVSKTLSPKGARLTKNHISSPSPTATRPNRSATTLAPSQSTGSISGVGNRTVKPLSPAVTRKIEAKKQPVGPRKSLDLKAGAVRLPPSVVRRGTSEESLDSSGHLSELESKLKMKKPEDKPKRPPQRPSAPPSRPKDPPKRPGPPKPSGAKKVPPPRPQASPPVKRNVCYVSVGEYIGGVDSCLSLNEGDEVSVIEKNDDGWWFVEAYGTEGWAPSSFLEEKETPAPAESKPSRPEKPKINAPSKPDSRPGPPKPEPRSGPPKPESRPRPPKPETRPGPPKPESRPGPPKPESRPGPPKPEPRVPPSKTEPHKSPYVPTRPRPPPAKKPSDEPDSESPAVNVPKPKPRARIRKASTVFVRAVSCYNDGSATLVQGRLYEVKEKRNNDWWLVKDGDQEVWAPADKFETIQ